MCASDDLGSHEIIFKLKYFSSSTKSKEKVSELLFSFLSPQVGSNRLEAQVYRNNYRLLAVRRSEADNPRENLNIGKPIQSEKLPHLRWKQFYSCGNLNQPTWGFEEDLLFLFVISDSKHFQVKLNSSNDLHQLKLVCNIFLNAPFSSLLLHPHSNTQLLTQGTRGSSANDTAPGSFFPSMKQ